MAHPMRKIHIESAQYQHPIVSCDTCLASHDIQVRLIPVVDGEGSPLRVLPPMQHICAACLSHATRPAGDVAVNGTLVYMHWSTQTEHIVRSFVFVPLMFRDCLF